MQPLTEKEHQVPINSSWLSVTNIKEKKKISESPWEGTACAFVFTCTLNSSTNCFVPKNSCGQVGRSFQHTVGSKTENTGDYSAVWVIELYKLQNTERLKWVKCLFWDSALQPMKSNSCVTGFVGGLVYRQWLLKAQVKSQFILHKIPFIEYYFVTS